MKREIINLIAAVGFVLLGAAAVLGVLTGVLFIFPNTSIFGLKSVNERDTQVIYDDEDLVKAFASGKIILESEGVQIEVKMSRAGYEGENTVVVNESATGIAFNSLNRTLIEWNQTLYGEETYYRIKVLEPSGMVFNQKPTTVSINLPYRNDGFRYDFVLRNRYSPVSFSFVDRTPSENAEILLDDLVVESASIVSFPYKSTNSINNVTVKGNNTKLTCKANVNNKVVVEGNNNVLEFGNSDLAGIGGDLTIIGNNNRLSGTSANRVRFEANNGSLNMSRTIATLDVTTQNAPITVNNVAGAVTMTTLHGPLHVNGTVGNGLTFIAGVPENPQALASVTAQKINGAAVVENYGYGNINLGDVNGDVNIKSSEVNGGTIKVGLRESGHSVNILGYDGDINVSGIDGGDVVVEVRGRGNQAGAADIELSFNKVGTAEIYSGGYLSGHEDWGGNVDVQLANNCNKLNMYIFYAGEAHISSRYGYVDTDMKVSRDESNLTAARNYIPGTDDGIGEIKIYSRRVYLH